jgi:hypothetical protein
VWFALKRPEGRFWLAIAILGTLLALGSAGHLLPWLAQHVPGFGLFRIAYRYKLITGFAAAIGAGLGMAALVRSPPSRRDQAILASGIAGWLIGVHAIARAVPPWSAVAVVVAFGAVVFDRGARRRWWSGALVVLVAVDLWKAGDTKMSIMQLRPDVDRGRDLVERMPGVAGTWRFHASRSSGSGGQLPVPYHTSYLRQVRELSGFDQPLASQRVLDVLAAARTSPSLLQHFNVKYYVDLAPRDATAIPSTPIRVAADAAPLARLYPRATLTTTRDVLTQLTHTTPARLEAALVEPADAPRDLPAASFRPVDGRLLSFARTSLTFEIDAPAAGILVVNETWAPWWHAYVDGSETRVFRANYFLRALVVPPGTHRVELVLKVPLYRGLLIADAVVGLLAIGLVIASRRRTKLRPAP